MKKIKFGEYLSLMIGDGDTTMEKKHAHHILYKTGKGKEQQALSKRGQTILRKYGIDPVIGLENLIWAPNIKGQHNAHNLKEIVEKLEQLDKKGTSYEEIVRTLNAFGNKAKMVSSSG